MAHPSKMTALREGTEDGVERAVCAAPMYGAANGYVLVPDDHPWRDLDYDHPMLEVEVHGGLTYGSHDGWIGFDTLHHGDMWPGAPAHWRTDYGTPWNVDRVVAETIRLAQQIAAARKAVA